VPFLGAVTTAEVMNNKGLFFIIFFIELLHLEEDLQKSLS
jgi:hypothetical protein